MVSPDHVQFWAKSLSFFSSSQADLYACCVHIWPCIYHINADHAIKHCRCPSASCSMYRVPCTRLIRHVYCTSCFVIKFNDFRLSWIAADCWIMIEWWKEDNLFVLLWDIWHKCEILGKSKNRRVSPRCLAGLNSCGISLSFCFIVPTSIIFFCFSVDLQRQQM